MKHKRRNHPHPYKNSITLDAVNAKDFQNLNITYCCEQCSHFDPENKDCTIGFVAKNHLKEVNLQNYELSGRLAFCRFLEID